MALTKIHYKIIECKLKIKDQYIEIIHKNYFKNLVKIIIIYRRTYKIQNKKKEILIK
jgi:hypothetical protein